ncbi:Calcium-dependent secretion activator [Fasciola gigantica]|uniref:Calcium-dependent secretion activator n=1 Tax=Fasciola gigantica TaxID=46835 RepID=A0A504YV70_FASGI|nr:Calcium-dependent secretion activator [Fasciola gigantica]
MDATNERMQQMIHLAELCIEVLKQNEEHHAESFAWFSDLFVAHAENFWSLFQMDLFDLMDHLPDWRWEVFDLFQLLNDYLSNDGTRRSLFLGPVANLCNGHFHQNLANRFDPLVDRYMELMSESIEQALITGYENEQWVPAAAVVGPGAASPSNSSNRLLNGATQIVQRPSLVKPTAIYTDHSPALSTGSSAGGIGKTQLAGSPRLARDSYTGHILGSTSGLPFTTEPFACPQSSSGMTGSSACQTVVELLWRLHKLKHFVQELSWPQPTKAKLLDERIRVLCAQMLREAVKRTLIELEISVRKCVKTPDLILPLECCTMLNTVTELRAHLFSLCHATEFSTAPGSPRYAATTTATTTTTTTVGAASITTNLGPGSSSTAATCTQSANQLHIETEEFFESVQRNMMVIVVDHFLIVLSGVLNKLTRFDENKLISSILTLTKPVDEEGRTYTNFLNVNLQRLSQNLVDEVSMLSLCEVEETAHNVRQDTGSTSSSSAGKRKLLSALANSGMFNRG